ncbi:hypothetical protein Bca101_005862 [Brassica carinata]
MNMFKIAMREAYFNDEEKNACYCQLFVESLTWRALNWFKTQRETDAIMDKNNPVDGHPADGQDNVDEQVVGQDKENPVDGQSIDGQ